MRGWLGEDVRILAYHRVLESIEPDGFSFDLDLISASAEAFKAQMLHVRRYFQPMRFDELADLLDHGKRPPRGALLVSFDDGYDDNYRVAFPILQELGMSAMFFVSTGHIDTGMPYPYDWLVYMLCSTGNQRLRIPELVLDIDLPPERAARRQLARWLLHHIKTYDADTQRCVIANLEQQWNLPRAQGHPQCRPMSWNDLRAMRAAGMEIGSHGVDHHMLSKLPPWRMYQEVENSKRQIECELGMRVDVLSYPVGGSDAYDPAVMHAARAAGYRLACSYRSGADAVTVETQYQLRRLPVERQMDAPWFEAMMALPEVFGYRSRLRNG